MAELTDGLGPAGRPPVDAADPRAVTPGSADQAITSEAADPRAVRVDVRAAMGVADGPWTVGADADVALGIQWLDAGRARLAAPPGHARAIDDVPIVLGAVDASSRAGIGRSEVVVGGWRVLLDIEPERIAKLRERARRGREDTASSGPLEVHAIIPGRVVAVFVAEGDTVEAGQQLLVVEAMKMQNELRSPRAGTVERIAVGAGQKVELGALLLVLR